MDDNGFSWWRGFADAGYTSRVDSVIKNANRNAIALTAVLIMSMAFSFAEPVQLIEGDVFTSFSRADGWSIVGSAEAVTGQKKLRADERKESGDALILINGTRKQKADYLVTKEMFRDVRISLEFMVPMESNAGVYVMGRYEIQILDSFGVGKLSHSILGGVYQRWDPTKKGKHRGYEGVPPLVNASKAPGEWQTMQLVFRAPRFDEAGLKVENARFVTVHVNDLLVQNDVEVTGPTRSHPLSGEAATGPVAIQGDHGPIAIRSYTIERLNLD